MTIRAVDLFCGAGGLSTGLAIACEDTRGRLPALHPADELWRGPVDTGPEQTTLVTDGGSTWKHLGNRWAHDERYRCTECGRERGISNRSDQYQEHGEPEPCDCTDGDGGESA
ncbi:hypothetical protein ACFQL1_15135 [Halomicroarcula sp. GCM10025709]|uniref:hypothetical protein n=1 Tax=Haloarcula TaxID=2237 RepID=UPI0024C4278E|nr:hypothetical protein [Halomicroarcula sp. YJ-61-S]